MTAEALTRADERASVESLARAFANYELLVRLCPDADRRPRVVAAFCRFLFRSAVRVGGAFGTPDRAAVACSWPAGSEWPSRWDAIRAGSLSFAWAMGFKATRLMARWEAEFDAARWEHLPEKHCYVPLLGVRPDAQGKGLSRVVLQPVLDRAARDRVPVYLETVPDANVAIYTKLGFELVGRRDLSGGLPNWEMVRRVPPRSSDLPP